MQRYFTLKKVGLILSILIVSAACEKDHQKILNNEYNSIFNKDSFSEWTANIPQNWEIFYEGGEGVLHLKKEGTFGKIRKPASYAILDDIDATDFELSVDVKCLRDTSVEGRDVVIIFGYQDSAKFYYTHISNINNNVHNIVGIVNNKDRERISPIILDASKARLVDFNWHKIKVIRNINIGSIKVFVDDMGNPIHSIIDKTLNHGKIGLGSFDDTAKFKNFKLYYEKYVMK